MCTADVLKASSASFSNNLTALQNKFRYRLKQHLIELGIWCRSWLQDSSQSLCTPLQMPQIIANFRHLGRP